MPNLNPDVHTNLIQSAGSHPNNMNLNEHNNNFENNNNPDFPNQIGKEKEKAARTNSEDEDDDDPHEDGAAELHDSAGRLLVGEDTDPSDAHRRVVVPVHRTLREGQPPCRDRGNE